MRWLIVLLLLAPFSGAQGHEHGPGFGHQVVSDVGPDGIAYVGSPTHFDLIAFGDDQVPDFHQDLPVRVLLNGAVLYETTAVSGHDYDGLHGLDIVFPRAGNWTVEIPGTGAELHGMAVEQTRAPIEAQVLRDLSIAGQFNIRSSANETPTAHTDHLVEVKAGDKTVLRTKLHAHADESAFRYDNFAGATHVDVTVFTAAPEQGAPVVPTTVFAPLDAQPALYDPAPATGAPPADANAAIVVGDGKQLIGTYDPFTTVGPDTMQHLQLLVAENGHVLRHMTYDVEFRGPLGLIFSSASIHEHDGIFELAARMPAGLYSLSATASHGDWQASITMPYLVAPSPAGLWVGPLDVATSTAKSAGRQALSVAIVDGGGRAFAHGELEFTMTDIGDLVLLRDKLHTHGTGTFQATLPVPCQQNHIAIDAFPLNGAVVREGTQPVATGDLKIEAAHDDLCIPRWMEPDFGVVSVPAAVESEEMEAPNVSPLLALALVGVILALRRRS